LAWQDRFVPNSDGPRLAAIKKGARLSKTATLRAALLDHAVCGEEDTRLGGQTTAHGVQLLVCGQNREVGWVQASLTDDGFDLILPSDADQSCHLLVDFRRKERPEEDDDGRGLADAWVEAGEVDEGRTRPVSHLFHGLGHGSKGDPHGL